MAVTLYALICFNFDFLSFVMVFLYFFNILVFQIPLKQERKENTNDFFLRNILQIRAQNRGYAACTVWLSLDDAWLTDPAVVKFA